MPRPALIVHGGAGFIPQAEHADYQAGCQKAAQIAWKLLSGGAAALHAVETAVRILEDEAVFDAGYGSVLNRDGEIEMDALIMDGATLNMGAVMAVKGVANPVTLARLVMTDTPHRILVGDGARAFAASQGIPLLSNDTLTAPKARERYVLRLQGLPTDDDPHDTVGAVALDLQGNVAAATSTGGTSFKMPGRVGDAPLIGCGAYADNLSGAASATGHGEDIMRVLLSKTAADAILLGLTAQQAADHAVKVMVDRVNGQGGLIVVDHAGNVGFAHSTPFIAVAWADQSGDEAVIRHAIRS